MIDRADKIFVIIPVLNEAEKIRDVIFGIKQNFPKLKILVIDDGSTDRTDQIAKNCNVPVISHSKNFGKGIALRTGFKEVLRSGGRYVITIDGDGQHNPKFIPYLLDSLRTKAADIAVGSRMNDLRPMPFHRKLSNKVTSALISLRAGNRIKDSQCGFRAIDLRIFKKIRLAYGGFQTESELLMRAGIAGFKIVNVPISTIYGTSRSTIHPICDSVKFMNLFFHSLFW